MAVRTTMLPLIKRVRQLINDPQSSTQAFDDQEIQDVLDESREDIVNQVLTVKPTYTLGQVQFLNYYSVLGGWEEDYAFKQFLSVPVTPNTLEPIAGHFAFTQSTLPPIYITGKLYDVHRAAADLLERLAARYALQFSFSSDGQSFHPEQIQANIAGLVKQQRAKQRPRTISMTRSDLKSTGDMNSPGSPYHNGQLIDYLASGNKES